MGDRCAEGVVGQGIDAAGLDHGGSAGVLDFAVNGEEGFLGDGEASLFEELRGNDGVGDAGFIFEADEDESFRGAGSLAADDQSGDANVLSISATAADRRPRSRRGSCSRMRAIG